MNFKEVVDHFLINVVRNLIFDPLHVLVELGKVPGFGVRVPIEQHSNVSLRLAFFGEERERLVDEVRYNIPIFIFPFNSEI